MLLFQKGGLSAECEKNEDARWHRKGVLKNETSFLNNKEGKTGGIKKDPAGRGSEWPKTELAGQKPERGGRIQVFRKRKTVIKNLAGYGG